MQVPFIDLKSQYKALKPQIDQSIQTVLDHGFFVNGPEVKQCEEELAQFVNAPHAIACGSGTDALIMALMALDIQPGDEVITTPFSFVATIECIALLGAVPILVDIDEKSFNIDPQLIEQAITEKTKAIMPVSLYGLLADMKAINAIAHKHGLTVIEDAAQSYGAKGNGLNSCAASTLATTSFFPAKPLGCYGDGGAIFTDNADLDLKLRQIRDHGSEKRYYHTRLGINGRMDTLQCAILSEKLKRYPWELEQRDLRAKKYTKAFSEIDSSKATTPFVPEGDLSAWAQYTLMVKDRDNFQAAMKDKGIPTAVHYPMTFAEQPAYKDLVKYTNIDVAQKATEQVVSLPIFPDMTDDIQDHVISSVIGYFN